MVTWKREGEPWSLAVTLKSWRAIRSRSMAAVRGEGGEGRGGEGRGEGRREGDSRGSIQSARHLDLDLDT